MRIPPIELDALAPGIRVERGCQSLEYDAPRRNNAALEFFDFGGRERAHVLFAIVGLEMRPEFDAEGFFDFGRSQVPA